MKWEKLLKDYLIINLELEVKTLKCTVEVVFRISPFIECHVWFTMVLVKPTVFQDWKLQCTVYTVHL